VTVVKRLDLDVHAHAIAASPGADRLPPWEDRALDAGCSFAKPIRDAV